MEAVRPELERFYKWWRSWKGTSGKTKRLMRRVDAVLSRCDDDEAQSLRVGKTNDALYQEAVSLRQKWTSESFDRTRSLSQANDDRRKRGELIERRPCPRCVTLAGSVSQRWPVLARTT